MSQTSDKNVAKVTKSDIDILNALIYVYEARLPNYNELMDSEVKSLKNILAEREQMLKARDVANDSIIAHKFAVMQQQLEQKDKRIQELEEQVKTLDEAYTGVIKESKKWFDIAHNSIPKQVVIDEVKRLSDMFNKTTEGRIQKYTVNEIIIRSNTLQELLEGESK